MIVNCWAMNLKDLNLEGFRSVASCLCTSPIVRRTCASPQQLCQPVCGGAQSLHISSFVHFTDRASSLSPEKVKFIFVTFVGTTVLFEGFANWKALRNLLGQPTDFIDKLGCTGTF